jgi:UDP:flavonoid glycosyltransferase YjiC (YdhE family)
VRVLFSSTFGYGHVFPMVPLARAFAAAGHQVLWATNGGARGLVSAAGLDVVAAGLTGPPLGELHQRLRQGAAEVPPQDRARYMFPRLFGEGLAPTMVSELLPVAHGFEPDLLVHEQGELAAPLVGAVLGVPSVTHSFGGAVPAPILAAAGERLAPLWAEHGRQLPPLAGCFTATYLDICPPAVQSVPIGHIERPQALRPVPYTGESSGPLPAVLDEDPRPLVYLTLGTVANNAPGLATAVAGLAKLDARILVTVGPDGDPEALGPRPAHVSVERYVSQTDVLPRCAAVVSHAGSGTFLGALGHGLPQLCLPQAADQFRNAEGAVRSGAGLSLHPDDTTPAAITDAVNRLLAEERFRRAAAVLADDIRAMPSPDEVVAVLETLV